MRRLAVGWVWTNDPTAVVVTTPKLLPLLGVGSWWWPVVPLAGILLHSLSRVARGTFRL